MEDNFSTFIGAILAIIFVIISIMFFVSLSSTDNQEPYYHRCSEVFDPLDKGQCYRDYYDDIRQREAGTGYCP